MGVMPSPWGTAPTPLLPAFVRAHGGVPFRAGPLAGIDAANMTADLWGQLPNPSVPTSVLNDLARWCASRASTLTRDTPAVVADAVLDGTETVLRPKTRATLTRIGGWVTLGRATVPDLLNMPGVGWMTVLDLACVAEGTTGPAPKRPKRAPVPEPPTDRRATALIEFAMPVTRAPVPAVVLAERWGVTRQRVGQYAAESVRRFTGPARRHPAIHEVAVRFDAWASTLGAVTPPFPPVPTEVTDPLTLLGWDHEIAVSVAAVAAGWERHATRTTVLITPPGWQKPDRAPSNTNPRTSPELNALDRAVALIREAGPDAIINVTDLADQLDVSVDYLRSALARDDRFTKVTVQGWGLADAGHIPYRTVVEFLDDTIAEHGGAVTLADATLEARLLHGHSPHSVRAVASTPRYVLTDGTVRRATLDEQPRITPEGDPKVTKTRQGWATTVTIRARHLRGYSLRIPDGFAAACGAPPDGSATVTFTDGSTGTARLPLASPSGSSLTTPRRVLTDLGVEADTEVRLTVNNQIVTVTPL